jgi:hypothetical protein
MVARLERLDALLQPHRDEFGDIINALAEARSALLKAERVILKIQRDAPPIKVFPPLWAGVNAELARHAALLQPYASNRKVDTALKFIGIARQCLIKAEKTLRSAEVSHEQEGTGEKPEKKAQVKRREGNRQHG